MQGCVWQMDAPGFRYRRSIRGDLDGTSVCRTSAPAGVPCNRQAQVPPLLPPPLSPSTSFFIDEWFNYTQGRRRATAGPFTQTACRHWTSIESGFVSGDKSIIDAKPLPGVAFSALSFTARGVGDHT